MAKSARVLAGRSGGELRFAFEEYDVGDAALREVPGDAASHTPAAGDHYVRCLFHAVPSILLTFVYVPAFLTPVFDGIFAPLAYREELIYPPSVSDMSKPSDL